MLGLLFNVRRLLVFGIAGTTFLYAGLAQAATVAYWRMESDSSATSGLQIGNEVAVGTTLGGGNSTLALPVPGGFGINSAAAAQITDGTGGATVANTNALDGSSGNDINATAASYPLLNVSSITVEGFFRTDEGTATLVSRLNGTTSGFQLDSANNVTATFYINGAIKTLSGTSAINLDTNYAHIAFTYDSSTGVANLYANGTLRNTLTVAGGGALYAGTETTAVSIGTAYDGGPNAEFTGGMIDEVRISDVALAPSQFLVATPEPSSLSLLGLALLAQRRPRRRRAA